MTKKPIDPRFEIWNREQWKATASHAAIRIPSPKQQKAEAWMAGQLALLPALKSVKNPTLLVEMEIERLEAYLEEEV